MGVLDLAVLAVIDRADGYGYEVVRGLRAAGLVGVVLTRGVATGAGLVLAAAAALLALPAVLRGGRRMAAVRALPEVRWLLSPRPDPASTAGTVARYLASLQPGWWLLRALGVPVLVAVGTPSPGTAGPAASVPAVAPASAVVPPG